MHQIPKRLSAYEVAEAQEAQEERERLARANRAKQVIRSALDHQGNDVGPDFHEFRPVDLPVTPGYGVIKAFRNYNVGVLTPEPIWEAWHGTKVAHIQSIGQRGLSAKRSRSSCLFGAGIYLTRWIPKAMGHGSQYIRRSSTAILTLLKCRVAMGNILDVNAHPEMFKTKQQRRVVGLDHTWQSLFCGDGTRVAYAHGGAVLNEEIVVYDDQQVQVQEIYLLAPMDQKPPETPKQRLGAREVMQLRRAEKDRRSQRDDLIRRHRCVQDGQVCRWATIQNIRSRDWSGKTQSQLSVISYCQRFSKQVSQYDKFVQMGNSQVTRNCSRWSPL